MNEKKSSIDSFSVSLGPCAKSVSQSREPELEPWNIVIYSDLGFRSKQPKGVRIAEWSEFMESCGIVLAGSVDGGLGADGVPTWIEHTVRSMRDFSAQSIATGAFAGLSNTLEILQRLLDGKITTDEARAGIDKTPIPPEEKTGIRALFTEDAPPDRSQPKRPAPGTPLDTILTMVDTGASTSLGASPQDASEALFSSLLNDSRGSVDSRRIAAYIEAGRLQLRRRVAAIQAQPFFASRKAAWLCLQRCAKIVGRKPAARIYVYSAPREEMEERFAAVLSECIDTVGAPDIILWDFRISFTNAAMQRAAALAQTADTYKCMLWAPVNMAEAFFQGIQTRDSSIPMLQEPRFLPLKKLRSDGAARCLCLFGPDATTDAGSDGDLTQAIPGCWPVLIRWLEMLVDGNNPYAVQRSGILPEPRETDDIRFNPPLSLNIRQEAARYAGVSLFSATALSAGIDKAVTLIAPDSAGPAYTSCGFNMLINRVARLCTVKLLGRPTSMDADEIALYLAQFLRGELQAYGVCASPDQISVKPISNQTVEIALASDVALGDVPARFAFSLDV